MIRVKALFQPETKWRLIEEFSVQSFKQLEDGTLLFQMDYTDEDNLVRWLLSFGEKVKVLEPKSVRDKLLETARQVLRTYEEENGKQICHKWFLGGAAALWNLSLGYAKSSVGEMENGDSASGQESELKIWFLEKFEGMRCELETDLRGRFTQKRLKKAGKYDIY